MSTAPKTPNIYDSMAQMNPSGAPPMAGGPPPSPQGAPDAGAQGETDESIIAKLLMVLQQWQQQTKNPDVVSKAVSQMSEILNDTGSQLKGEPPQGSPDSSPAPAPGGAPESKSQPTPA